MKKGFLQNSKRSVSVFTASRMVSAKYKGENRRNEVGRVTARVGDFAAGAEHNVALTSPKSTGSEANTDRYPATGHVTSRDSLSITVGPAVHPAM